MALFSHNRHSDVDPFTDLLFNALLTFTFLFMVALLLLNPPAKTGIVDPKAEFMVTITWEENNPNDMDLWVQAPDGELIWYKQPEHGLIHLDRDDRGIQNDTIEINGEKIINPLNQEVLTLRGRPPGEYIINVHYYLAEVEQEMPIKVSFAEVNPKMKILFYKEMLLKKEDEEQTALRFTLNEEGNVSDINQLPKSLIRGKKS